MTMVKIVGGTFMMGERTNISLRRATSGLFGCIGCSVMFDDFELEL